MQLLVTNYLKPSSMSTETKKVATVMYNYNTIFIISITNNLELKEKNSSEFFELAQVKTCVTDSFPAQ